MKRSLVGCTASISLTVAAGLAAVIHSGPGQLRLLLTRWGTRGVASAFMRRVVAVTVVGLVAGCGTGDASGPSATTRSTTSGIGRAVLSPATVPPRVDECSEQLHFGANGTAGPITCRGGRLNALAWTYYDKGDPLVLTIGPDASPDQVLRAMCSDLHGNTKPIVLDTYHLALRYYGWRFGVNPAQAFEEDNC